MLTKKFIGLIEKEPDGVLDLNHAADVLQVSRNIWFGYHPCVEISKPIVVLQPCFRSIGPAGWCLLVRVKSYMHID